MSELTQALTMHAVGAVWIAALGIVVAWVRQRNQDTLFAVFLPVALAFAGGGTFIAFQSFRTAYVVAGLPPVSLLAAVTKVSWMFCWGAVALAVHRVALDGTTALMRWTQ